MFTEDIIGTVAKVGKVDDENLSELLSEYLGTRTMLAVVCKTREGVKALETYYKEDNINRNAIRITTEGRFDVICLENLRPYGGQLIANDQQRGLDLLKPTLPNGKCPLGFLGFAVNMIHIDPDHLFCITSHGYGLRETLFYSLFCRLQVYRTRADMINALPCISQGAISLDGGIIRTAGIFSLGSNDKVNVRFAKPAVGLRLPDNYGKAERRMKKMRWEKEKLEEDIKRGEATLRLAKFNFGKRKEELLQILAQSSSYHTQSNLHIHERVKSGDGASPIKPPLEDPRARINSSSGGQQEGGKPVYQEAIKVLNSLDIGKHTRFWFEAVELLRDTGYATLFLVLSEGEDRIMMLEGLTGFDRHDVWKGFRGVAPLSRSSSRAGECRGGSAR